MDVKQMIMPLLSHGIKELMLKVKDDDFAGFQEIRLRVNRPLVVNSMGQFYCLDPHGYLTLNEKAGFVVTAEAMQESIELMSDYSMYAYEEELRSGYITVRGGHRIGMAGKTILEDGHVKSIRHISCVNIRIAHEIPGCADLVMPFIKQDDHIHHTLIVSPPGKGKTTLLRDVIRQLSNKDQINVAVVDERSEIAACFKGVPQLDIGLKTDVLDGCPKAEGMMMLLRAMGPQVIAVDEIGSPEDIKAIEHIVVGGVKLICTVHGDSYEDLLEKPRMKELIEKDIFKRLIFLGSDETTGKIVSVKSGKGRELYMKEGKTYVY